MGCGGWTPVTGKDKFSIGIGTLILALNVCLLSGYTFGCHSLRHLIGGGRDTLSIVAGFCHKALQLAGVASTGSTCIWGVVQPHYRSRLRRLLRTHKVLSGPLDGLENLLMADYPVQDYDVLVIGAGGAWGCVRP